MILSNIYQAFATRVSTRSAHEERPVAPPEPRRVVSLWGVGRNTVDLFRAHAGMVLGSALLGFAGVGILAQLLSLIAGGANGFKAPAIFLAALGLLLQSLGQGALAWVGLHGATPVPAPMAAVRAAFRRWPYLLPGALFYAILTFAGAVSLALLIGTGSQVSTGSAPSDPPGVLRLVATRSIYSITLGPLHPLAELVPPAQDTLTQLGAQPSASEPGSADLARQFEMYIPGARPADLQAAYRMVLASKAYALWANAALPYALIALACLLLLVAAEVLLRFRAVAAMELEPSPKRTRGRVFAPVMVSARLGLRHLRPVMASALALRLAVSTIQIVCIIAPVAVTGSLVLPQLVRLTTAAWVGPACRLLCILGGTMMSAILAALCALYDARLFVALQKAEWR